MVVGTLFTLPDEGEIPTSIGWLSLVGIRFKRVRDDIIIIIKMQQMWCTAVFVNHFDVGSYRPQRGVSRHAVMVLIADYIPYFYNRPILCYFIIDYNRNHAL